MTDRPDEDGVGYGRPPVSRRFGQPDGNARGRGKPKGSRNVSTRAAEALSAQISVKEGGRVRKMSKLDAGLTQLANQAASGDLKAIQLVLSLAHGLEAKADAQSPPTMPLTQADRRVLALLSARVRHGIEENPDD
jgi:hypothetical protein